MRRELIKNTGIYIATGFIAQLFVFFIWIILARFLPPSEIGIYALALFVIDFFSVISIFGLDSAITRYYYSKEGVGSILNNALVIFIGSSFLTFILFLLASRAIIFFIPGISEFLDKNLFLFAAIIFTNSIANFAFAHYTALKKSLMYAKLQLLKVALFCLLSLFLLYAGLGILGVFYATLFSSLGIAAIFLLGERKTISPGIVSGEVLKTVTSYGFPLMVYGVFGIMAGYFSRLLLDKYTNLTTLGVYSFFLTLTIQVNGLWGGFNRAWAPEIFSKFMDDKKKTFDDIKFMAFFSCFVYLAAFALFVFLGNLFLFKIVLKEVYLSDIRIFYVLLLAPLFTGIYTAAYPLYYYENKTKRILFVSILLSLVNIFLTFYMVKFFSQTGAALSFFAISVLTVLAYFAAFGKIMGIPKEIIRWSLLLSVLTVLGVAALLMTRSLLPFLALIILSAALAYRLGNLAEKKYLLFDFLKALKSKTVKPR